MLHLHQELQDTKARGPLTVLGIDPGLAITGYGVITLDRRRLKSLGYGVIRTNREDGGGGGLPKRLLSIYESVIRVLDTYHPDQVAMEHLFFSKNRTSGMFVSEARGVIALAIEQHGLPLSEYTPNQVKQAITGSGKADKVQMQTMIMRILSLPEIPKPDDAADGLCIALCHLHVTGGGR